MMYVNVKNRDGGTMGHPMSAIKANVAGLDGRIGVAVRRFAERWNFTGLACSNERACYV